MSHTCFALNWAAQFGLLILQTVFSLDTIHVMYVFTYQLKAVLPLNSQSDHLHQLRH